MAALASTAVLLALAILPRPSAGLPDRSYETCDGGYADPENFAFVQSQKVAEASGIVSSIANEGVLWTHEDSGKHARLYAISLKSSPPGEIVAKIDLDAYTDEHDERPDFEDI